MKGRISLQLRQLLNSHMKIQFKFTVSEKQKGPSDFIKTTVQLTMIRNESSIFDLQTKDHCIERSDQYRPYYDLCLIEN